MTRKQSILLATGAVVVAGVAGLVLFSDNYPPTDQLTGAIGGVEKAERYRDTQVTADDVARVYDAEGYDQLGYDKEGFTKAGLDKNGFDRGGFDRGGFDRGGFDKNGFDKNGIVGFDKFDKFDK
jgi:hypothetical protein